MLFYGPWGLDASTTPEPNQRALFFILFFSPFRDNLQIAPSKTLD